MDAPENESETDLPAGLCRDDLAHDPTNETLVKLWRLYRCATAMDSAAVDLTTPPYYIHEMPGRRQKDVEALVDFYVWAKEIVDNEDPNSFNGEEILRRMRSCVADAFLRSSFDAFDPNTCGETSAKRAIDMLCYFPYLKPLPSIPAEILEEIKCEVICLLLTTWGRSNRTDEHSETVLMAFTKKDKIDLKVVLDLAKTTGVTLFLDQKDSRGRTALMLAVELNEIEKVKLLVENGASVNAQDNRGFTALHAAIHDRRTMDVTFQTFLHRLSSKELNSRQDFIDESLTSDNENEYQFKDEFFKLVQDTKQEFVKILLSSRNADVNVVDFTGKTPLDHALEPRTIISKRIVDLLREKGAVSSKIDASPYEDNVRGQGRGRTALHRLIIEQLAQNEGGEVQFTRSKEQLETESYDNMLTGVHSQREKFGILVEIKDEKGRTVLHYAAWLSAFNDEYSVSLCRLLLGTSSNVNVTDDNRQTPLHFARSPPVYDYFVSNGANEEVIDKWGHTPKSLYQVRSLLCCRRQELYKLLYKVALILCKERLQLEDEKETLLVDGVESNLENNEEQQREAASTSSGTEMVIRPSLKEAKIWKIYTEINGQVELTSRLECINIKLQDLVARIADAIGKRDPRFKCKSKLIGSSNDGTKLDFPGDFDFDLNLVELSKYCEAVPSITTSPGYVHLKKNISDLEEYLNFGEFFNEEQLLLTNKVNFMFKFHLLRVLNDPDFWKTEELFELDIINEPRDIYDNTDSLHSEVRIRMTHPIDDLNGDQMFFDTLFVDIVPSISAPGQCIKEALVDAVRGERSKNCDYNLVFDTPQRFCPWVPFKDTFARVSFVVAETNAIRNCPSVLKAAYIVVRAITRGRKPMEHSYYLKTCLLYCIETFESADIKVNDDVTKSNLYFWVERILFCYAEFFSQDFLPCYFMPFFSQPTGRYLKHVHMDAITRGDYSPLSLFGGHDIYAEICSTGFDSDINRSCPQPLWENFNREKLMKKLSKRLLNNSM